MSDVPEAAAPLPAARRSAVRPRDAASLIVLRGKGRDLELLAGRRPLHLKFMPGVYVFPGGGIDREDRAPWSVEAAAESLTAVLRGCARAALRETWEETGVLVGRSTEHIPAVPPRHPIERAYAERGLIAAFDLLTYVGRAITPSQVFRRFNTRFFLCDGSHVVGEPCANDEFEDVGWHPIGRRPMEPIRDVTRFMLARAIAIREGTASPEAPLFCTVGNTRRVRVCREALRGD
ncbi:MAG: NUDIX domain-containing protein [Alphaproteobacteria bacterium]|nr:NUDIX domain-containing protein [Alphaproteobacteria bacterium]